MSLLRSIETSIARLVEGSFGKLFRTSVQPVELARRLVKEMDEHQQRTVRNVYVPNGYDVFLSRDDYHQLSPYAAALTTELSEYLAEHARRNGYALLTRPRVRLHLDRDLAVGRFGISIKMEQPDDRDGDLDGPSGESAPPAATVAPAAPVAPMTPPTPPTPLPLDPFDGPSPEAAVAASEALGLDPMLTSPAAAPPAPTTPAACGVFGNGAPHPLGSGVTRARVGRGRANDIVLQDASVSREHGEFVLRGGTWFVRDLDSTNGVAVNGSKVTEAALEPGDVVRFGNADLRFDRWRDGQE
ncbi:MAG: hypothetical protein JWN72_2278 [Thermoleophilia bacterium]|nr:hypothetical protein [Thermoleophilia bacterium]